MKSHLFFVVAVVLGVSAVAVAIQEETVTVQAGVYSDDQATRGETVFNQACIVCHQPEEFTMGGYMDGWSGQSVGDFVDFIRSTMPEDNPGRLQREEYIDVVAFMFQQNGLPSGDADMTRESIGGIQIEGPYNPVE